MANTQTAPYNDNYMTYNYDAHMYVLTEKAILDFLGENLHEITNFSPVTLNAFLLRNSRTVFNYIYESSQASDYIEYILAMDVEQRERIQTMLLAQVEYTLFNGAIDVYSGVNISKGQYIDLKEIRGNRKVADTVEIESAKIMPKYGFCLRFGGRLPHVPIELYHVGY